MADQWQMKPRTHCPQCGTVLELTVRCTAQAVVDGRDTHGDQATAADHEALVSARRAGLLEPFAQTVRFVHDGQVPKDLDRFFLDFLRGMKRRLIPQYAMDEFNVLFGRRHVLVYYATQGIGVVVVGGYMRLFVPNSQVLGTRLKQLTSAGSRGTSLVNIDDGHEKLRAWLKAGLGTVAGEGALYEPLRHGAIGALPEM